jgi:hypothetical protein
MTDKYRGVEYAVVPSKRTRRSRALSQALVTGLAPEAKKKTKKGLALEAHCLGLGHGSC